MACSSVGYADGFLRGEPMAFHAYCITGTDGDGPTTAVTKALCHANDGLQVGDSVALQRTPGASATYDSRAMHFTSQPCATR
jgi:hypothetical protein